MKILDSLAEFVVLLQRLMSWPWWWLAIWAFLLFALFCSAVLLWLGAKGSVPDPDDDAQHLEWLRSESRRRESQLPEDAQ